jgi:cytochrome c5
MTPREGTTAVIEWAASILALAAFAITLHGAGPTGVGHAAATTIALTGMSGTRQDAPSATRSTVDGVYTSEQADRGEREFGRSCEHCHGRELEGDRAREVPPLTGDPFLRTWRGRPIKALFDMMSRSMPADRRGTLSARTYTELVAFLLRANGFPAGPEALPTIDGLESVVMAAATGPTSGR